MLKWKLSQIATLLEVEPPKKDLECLHYCIDSRQVRPGSVFFAIQGEKFDGHSFLPQVFEQGAVAAIVSKPCPGFEERTLSVQNVTVALQTLASFAAQKRNEKVVAITGSMGKTTTKEFLATLLEAKYRVFKTPGNQNTQLSVPLMLLNLEGEYDLLVIEMGMSAHGHIETLVKLIPPDLSIVTRIAPAGMEGFVGGLEAIAQAKSEIFSSPKTQLGLISRQAATYEAVCEAGALEKQLYANYRWVEGGIVVEGSPLLPLNFTADHLIENAVGAISAARLLGLSWSEIASKTGELKPFDKRFEVIEKRGVTFVQDCYNANPDSVIAALRNLPKVKGCAFGVLGTMPDLGVASQDYHHQVGLEATKYLDELLCIGEETGEMLKAFATSGKPVSHYSSLSDVQAALESKLTEGDVVLIKGANFLKLWNLMGDLCCCS